MKNKLLISLIATLILSLIIFIISTYQNSIAYQSIPRTDYSFSKVDGINENLITAISLGYDNNENFYLGTNKFLYISEDKGVSWRPIISVKAYINCIYIENNRVYAGTDKGLFVNFDNVPQWDLIFSGKEGAGKNILTIAKYNEKIFIGNENGLYSSYDNAKTWKRIIAVGSSSVTALIKSPLDANIIYVATGRGLLKFNIGSQLCEKVFDIRKQEVDEIVNQEDLEGKEYEELSSSSNEIKSIIFSDDKRSIYIGTQQGIFMSDSEGKIWTRFISQGLLSNKINKLVISSGNILYAATDKGLFKFVENDKTWREINKGLNTIHVKDLAIDKKNNEIYAATSHGLFKSNSDSISMEQYLPLVLQNFSKEPTIKQVQKQAIIYGEVHPDKINSWRKLAATKALLPKLTADADRYVTDLTHWDSGQNPDVLIRGRDAIQWGVSLTWDFGNLVWNADQTSIDTRSRLMVQLRQDILDEVNRVYFERRRLQIELLKSPPIDEARVLEKELRIAELTADLDGLTGGYFSQQIAQTN